MFLAIWLLFAYPSYGSILQHGSRGEEADSIPDETQEIILVNHFMGK